MNAVLKRGLAWIISQAREKGLQIHAIAGAIRRPGDVTRMVEQAWQMLAMGAIVVRTPDGDRPMLMSAIQLDGDIISFVEQALLTRPPAARAALCEAHFQAVRDALLPFDQLAKLQHGVAAALTAVFAVLQAKVGIDLLQEVIALNLPSEIVGPLRHAIIDEAFCLTPLVLRWALPHTFRWLLEIRAAPLLQQWNVDTEASVQVLKVLREARLTA